MFRLFVCILLICMMTDVVTADESSDTAWLLIDNFEAPNSIAHWNLSDPDNQTRPLLENPQVTEIRLDAEGVNSFLIKKPAPEGVVGNRKALSSVLLPTPVNVGETYTFYTRVNVEYFPNNHSFGLSNQNATAISKLNYNAFEPIIRITDKAESDGTQNDGTLMVSKGYKQYAKVVDPVTGKHTGPMQTDTWYELWYVVNNAVAGQGGQRFDLYIRGGEFEYQQQVFSGADFRMQRAQPLISFMAICNTGSVEKPYGNGGVRYDDLYMARGLELSTPE